MPTHSELPLAWLHALHANPRLRDSWDLGRFACSAPNVCCQDQKCQKPLMLPKELTNKMQVSMKVLFSDLRRQTHEAWQSCLKLGSCGSPWFVNTIFLPDPPEITFHSLICYWGDQRDISVYNSGCNFIRKREVPCSAHKLLNNGIFCTPATQNNSKLTQVHPRDIWSSMNFSEWPEVLIYNLIQTQINCSFMISRPAWEHCSQHAHHNAFNEHANR